MKRINCLAFLITSIFNMLIVITMSVINIQTASSDEQKRAIVYIHKGDKKKITGYVPIAYTRGQQLEPPRELSRGLANLVRAMNDWTKVETELVECIELSSGRLHQMPFVYITSKQQFELTETEKEKVKEYIQNGGFIIAENPEPRNEMEPGGVSLKQMLKDVIPNARFKMIPNDHELYHCFFDFDDGPPTGSEISLSWISKGVAGRIGTNRSTTTGSGVRVAMSKQVLALEGIWLKDRLVAVYSDKGYIVKWNSENNNTPQLRMGVNMIIFSLIQKGGIADKL